MIVVLVYNIKVTYIAILSDITLSKQSNKNRFGTLFDGIDKSLILKRLHNPLLLIKKTLFIGIIVYCYDEPLL